MVGYEAFGPSFYSIRGEFLDYNVLAHDGPHGQHLGIFLVELGVGVTVAAVMVTVFTLFAGRERQS